MEGTEARERGDTQESAGRLFPVHIHVLSNFIGNNNFIFLSICPICARLNAPVAVGTGRCKYCGYDINADTETGFEDF
jgi:hypothetical protein